MRWQSGLDRFQHHLDTLRAQQGGDEPPAAPEAAAAAMSTTAPAAATRPVDATPRGGLRPAGDTADAHPRRAEGFDLDSLQRRIDALRGWTPGYFGPPAAAPPVGGVDGPRIIIGP